MKIFSRLKNISILYVEDSKTIREAMIHKLEDIFEKIYVAVNGQEGLEMLQKHEDEIDLIITDLIMPVLDGPEMIKEIRRRRCKVPIIVTTSNSELLELDSVIEYGIEGFLTKPIDLVKLLARVNSVVTSIFQTRELKLKKQMIDNNIIYAETDEEAKITYVSKPFENITGYKSDELIGKTFGILKSNQNQNELYIDMWDKLNSKQQWQGELVNKRKDGSFYTINLVIFPMYFRKKLIGYSSISIDVTELKEASIKLQHISRHAAMGEMISMIAHQWRQPITTIGMIANNINFSIMMGELDEDTVKQNLYSIDSQVRYLSNTIDIFRNFLKKDKKKEEFDMQELLDELVSLIKDDLSSCNIELNVLNNINKYKGYTYKDELIQAMINIITNAKEALLECNVRKPKIDIVCYDDKKSIFIEIYDNAKGIEEQNLSKLFTPYFSTKTAKNGTGLGLYMTKTIIEESLDGEISVKNLQEGGAMFSIKLQKQ